MDVILIGFQALLGLFLPAETAFWWAGILISPLMHVGLLALFFHTTRGWMAPRARWLALLVFLWGDAIGEQMSLGRADHHGLIHLSHLLLMGGALSMLREREAQEGLATSHPDPLLPCPRWFGLGGALGLWVSMECSVMLYLLQTLLAIGWWAGVVQAGRGMRAAGWWLLAGLLVALVLERPPGNWLEVQYDRFSIVHVWVGAISALFWSWLAFWEDRWPPHGTRRTLVLAAGVLGGLLAVWVPFPPFIRGPYATLGPQMAQLMNLFMDMRPLWPFTWKTLPFFVLLAGPFLAGIPIILAYLWSEWPSLPRARLLFLVLPLPVLVIALVSHIRMAVLIEFFLPYAAGPALDWFLTRAQAWRWPLARAAGTCLAVFALTLGPYVGAALVTIVAPSSQTGSAPPAFDPGWVKAVCEDLNDPAIVASPTIVVAWLNYGPQIVCRTRHGVVGTPIHRNERGLADTVTVFGSTDDEAIRKVFRERGADLFLYLLDDPDVILPGIGRPPAGSLPDRLNRGEIPSWLHPVPLERAASTPFRLYKVDPGSAPDRSATQ
ncbi:MAG: hypothetical protein OZSIB_0687 [Candidatus Ozemobacter sibiricus]|uniref:Uncharacterized protein n=1 Tax=Candidatus Ozemobacter sibiricus TaxID=2268124 RepID=A0A367ZTT0_9BACT|nr:MAG: hypothetical protein OZSIB_0687 [Candidatus Ozemobacter sibiricus]